jgi:hypothetical protein
MFRRDTPHSSDSVGNREPAEFFMHAILRQRWTGCLAWSKGIADCSTWNNLKCRKKGMVKNISDVPRGTLGLQQDCSVDMERI